uniref:CTCK domain-containing protein n=1 Tax=Anopheles farauti TaxID=69004 RepID=A0A182Q866_9DIPT
MADTCCGRPVPTQTHSSRRGAMANVCALSLAVVLLAALHGVPATANREHKVHNIVLYPNKQSWCTTRNISQVITEPGCKQVTIDNNVCVGACFSYSIPHTEPSDPGEVIGPYCDSCQPSDVSYVFVKVDCTGNANVKSPYLYKQVQLIHNCTCTACDEQHREHPETSAEHLVGTSGEQLHHRHQQPSLALDKDQDQAHGTAVGAGGSDETPEDMIQDDIPEILEVVHYSENDTEPIRHTPVHDLQSPHSGTTYMEQQQLNHYDHNSHTDNVKKLLHQKIVKLLRSIEETNSPSDREQLIEMIQLIKGTSDRNWDELVESLQSENAILDFDRLRTELVEDEPLSVAPSLAEATEHGGSKKQTIQQQSAALEYADHQRLMHHQYDSLRHRHDHAPKELDAREEMVPEKPVVQDGTHQHAAHHHVAGERVDAHHHLARGPHGALVIQADRTDTELHRSHQNGHEIKERIHIQAHELKPNHAGTIVTYDGHGPKAGTEQPHKHAHHGGHHKHAEGERHGHLHEHDQQAQHHGGNAHNHHKPAHTAHGTPAITAEGDH